MTSMQDNPARPDYKALNVAERSQLVYVALTRQEGTHLVNEGVDWLQLPGALWLRIQKLTDNQLNRDACLQVVAWLKDEGLVRTAQGMTPRVRIPAGQPASTPPRAPGLLERTGTRRQEMRDLDKALERVEELARKFSEEELEVAVEVIRVLLADSPDPDLDAALKQLERGLKAVRQQ